MAEQIFEPIEFDLSGARAAGYPDAEIANQLAKMRNVDVDAARRAGYDDDEIIHILQTGKPYERVGGPVTAIGRGIVKGLSETAGAAGAVVSAANPVVAAIELAAAGTGQPSPIVGPLYETMTGLPRQISPDLTYEKRSDLPPEQRPFAVGGEVIGGSVPFASLPLGLARTGLKVTSENLFGRLFGGILDSARTSPKTFAAAEAVSIAGGAQGGALMSAIAPDSELARIGGEVVGSVVSPTSVPIMAGKAGFAGIKKLTQSMSREGRIRAAGDYVHAVISQFGEDPVALTAALRAADEMGLNLPAGVKTGSPGIMALEKNLAKYSSPFDLRVEQRIESALSSLRRSAEMLEARGNPADLRQAAVLRNTYHSQLVDGVMRRAEQRVAEARAAVAPASAGARMAASQEAFEALDGALASSRAAERELWEAVPRHTPVPVTGLRGQMDAVRAELLPGEPLTGIPAEFVRIIDEAETVGSQELIRVRSRLLALSRQARSQQRWADARHFGMMADGALQDLENLPGHQAELARDFSRLLNDRFSRTFAGTALGEQRTGAQRIPPEVMMDRAFGSGAAPAAIRFRQLREAGELGAMAGGEDFVAPIVNAQENFLRAAATASRNPETGAISPDRLARFVSENEPALSMFPHLRETLGNAVDAERAFRDAEALTGRFTRRISQVDAFARLIDFENPAMAVGAALNGKNPVADFQSMARFAKRSGSGAVGGLRASTLDYAMNAATDASGNISFNKLAVELLRPKDGKPAVLDLMRQNGVISQDQAERLGRIIAVGRHVENRSAFRGRVGEALETTGGLEDMLSRILGSKIGRVVSAAEGRAESLIAAAAGSRFLRNLFQRVPATRTRDLLIEAVEDPALMAELLEAGRPPAKAAASQISGAMDILREARFRRIHSVLWNAALVPDNE